MNEIIKLLFTNLRMLDFLPSKAVGGVLEESEENVSRFFPQGKSSIFSKDRGRNMELLPEKR